MYILAKHDVELLLDALNAEELDYCSQLVLQNAIANAAETPPRTRIGNRLFMPAPGGCKIVTLNTLVPIQGVVELFEEDGRLLALLDASSLTGFRTALTSLMSLNGMEKSGRVAIFGAGEQAFWHIVLLNKMYDFREFIVFNRSPERIGQLQKRILGKKLDVVLRAAIGKKKLRSYKPCLIVCCTGSTKPLFAKKDLNDDVHIILVGSHTKEMCEVGRDVIDAAARIFVDSVEHCLEEAGELSDTDADRLTPVSEATTTKGITVYKGVGFGALDVAVAKALVTRAKARGIGSTVEF